MAALPQCWSSFRNVHYVEAVLPVLLLVALPEQHVTRLQPGRLAKDVHAVKPCMEATQPFLQSNGWRNPLPTPVTSLASLTMSDP